MSEWCKQSRLSSRRLLGKKSAPHSSKQLLQSGMATVAILRNFPQKLQQKEVTLLTLRRDLDTVTSQVTDCQQRLTRFEWLYTRLREAVQDGLSAKVSVLIEMMSRLADVSTDQSLRNQLENRMADQQVEDTAEASLPHKLDNILTRSKKLLRDLDLAAKS